MLVPADSLLGDREAPLYWVQSHKLNETLSPPLGQSIREPGGLPMMTGNRIFILTTGKKREEASTYPALPIGRHHL